MYRKFKPLNIPDGWEQYWSKYPNGYSILEALIDWVSQVDDMVENQNELTDTVKSFGERIDEFINQFGAELQNEVQSLLTNWQNSGFLNIVISEALQWQLDDYIATNEQDKLSITTQLQQTEKTLDGVRNVSSYDNVQSAIDSLSNFEHVRFNGGELEISEPIIINKRNIRLLSNGIQRIKAIEPMSACIIFQSSGTDDIVFRNVLKGLRINGNKLADMGILIHDSVGQYASDITLSDIEVVNCLLDGIHIKGPAWSIKIDHIISEYNGRDGIRALMSGTKQVNAVEITNCFIQSNDGNGVTLNGTQHVVKNNIIERNTIGVSVDATLNNGQPAWSNKQVISENYFELNRVAQIGIKSSSNGYVYGFSVVDNYLLGSNNPDDVGTSLIKCEGFPNVGGVFKRNFNDLGSGNATTAIDGGDVFVIGTLIEGTSNVVNSGMARIESIDKYVKTPISAGTIQNATYDLFTNVSDNILSKTEKRITFGFPEVLTNKVIRSVGVFVDTDATDYTIRIVHTIRNIVTGELVKQGYQEITKQASAHCFVNVINSWGNERRKENEYLFAGITSITNNGTSLKFHVPYIEWF